MKIYTEAFKNVCQPITSIVIKIIFITVFFGNQN